MSLDFVKNKYTLILLLIAILLAGGVFYWQSQKPTPPDKWDTAEVSQTKDYKIIEQEGGLLVKNKKAGFNFKLPKDWEFEENFSTSSGSGVAFASPGLSTGTRTSVVAEGCRLKIGIAEINTNFETFQKKLKEKIDEQTSINSNIISKKFDVIKIEGYQAVRQEFVNRNFEMYFIRVSFPANQKVYEIGLDSAVSNKKECKKEFNNILDTVSIQ